MRLTQNIIIEKGVKLSAGCTYIRDNRRRQCSLLQALPVKALKPSKRESSTSWSMQNDILQWENEQIRIIFIQRHAHLCFWMSLTPFFKFPSRSEGLSLQLTHKHTDKKNKNMMNQHPDHLNVLKHQTAPTLTCIAF